MENLMTEVVKKLDELHKTISTMESCTGGRVASEITNISGASDILKFSAVTYSSEYKIKMGVSSETIEKYTVYSPNVAREMSKSISEFSNSNYGVGITGKMDVIKDKQKRLENNKIYISIYDKDNDIYYEEIVIGEYLNRVENKTKVVNAIINKLIEIIK